MFGYFILFLIIGFLVARVVAIDKTVFIIFIVIALGWTVSFGPVWGLVSFGEMCAGYAINKLMNSDSPNE